MDKVDLDRNFKLKEKMELLWADSDSSLSQGENDEPTLSLKQKVEQKRINRLRRNKQQADAYSTTLQKCTQNRDGDLQPEEIKMMNLVRIVVEGGWVIDEQVLSQIL